MRNSQKTKDTILETAKAQFWTRGYSNVSMRAIAKESGIDVALVAKYFGNKLKLFEATLSDAFDWPEALQLNPMELHEAVIQEMAYETDPDDNVTTIRMLLMNASDPEVGNLVIESYKKRMLEPLGDRLSALGTPLGIALSTSVIVGLSQARKVLKLPALQDLSQDEVADVLRYLTKAALDYRKE